MEAITVEQAAALVPGVDVVETPRTTHELAGTKMTGADMVVQVLADEGVDTVFGYSGGAILPTYDAVFRHNAERPRENVT